MLTDFGLSKEGMSDVDKTKSFCGSIAYLAPEIINRTGHGKSLDWYLVGVLLYEMLVGQPPYFSENRYHYFGLSVATSSLAILRGGASRCRATWGPRPGRLLSAYAPNKNIISC